MAEKAGGLGGLFGGKKEGEKKGGGIGAEIGGALFGRHESAPDFQATDISNQMNNLSRRLKMIEERYTNIRNKTQMTDQNMLEFNKGTNRSLKTTNSELMELRKDFNDLKEKVKLIVKELKDTAKSDDLKLLEKYINLWEPVNFVTKNDVEKIVEEKISEITQQPTK